MHVCVATGQNLANLIPILQLGGQEVVILETPEMRENATNLKRALAVHGVPARRVPFDDTSPITLQTAAQDIAQLLDPRAVVLNATGGTKLMVLALVEHLRLLDTIQERRLHVVYVETLKSRLDWLAPAPTTEPIEDVLDLRDIAAVQGYRIRRADSDDGHWQRDAAERETLTRRLGDGAEKLAGFFGILNSLADAALPDNDDGPFVPLQNLPYSPGESYSAILKEAQERGLLHWDRRMQVTFRNRDAARYFRGGWLEEYAWLKLRGIRPRDFSVGVEIETLGSRTLNELDVLAVNHNRLLVIECKTSRFGRDQGRDAQVIYKLDHLAGRIGGLMNRKLLLSARPLSDEVMRRAQDTRVDVLAAGRVAQLGQYLRQWKAA